MNRTTSLFLVLGLGVCTQALADLTADQIIDKSIQATGGKAAYDRQKTLVMTGTIEVKMQGLKGSIVTYQKDPDKVLVVTTLPGLGDFKQGYDGKTAWAQDRLTGLRKLEGQERAAFIREANNSVLKWKTLYTSIKVTGKVKVGDRDTYAVKLVPKEGEPSTQYFDVETFLVLRADVVQKGPQGTMAVQNYLSDYRVVSGVKMPFMTTMKTPVGDMVLQLTSVKANTPIDDAKFAFPKGK